LDFLCIYHNIGLKEPTQAELVKAGFDRLNLPSTAVGVMQAELVKAGFDRLNLPSIAVGVMQAELVQAGFDRLNLLLGVVSANQPA
jgi:hypothetical protein